MRAREKEDMRGRRRKGDRGIGTGGERIASTT